MKNILTIFFLSALILCTHNVHAYNHSKVAPSNSSNIKAAILQAKLAANDGATNDHFGYSVSVSGDRALVGARGDDDLGQNSGAAYIYDFDGKTWSQSAKLVPSDGDPDDRFGDSVSLSGNRALIGSVYDDDNGQASGAAYVFDLIQGSWSESAKLKPNDGGWSDYFGGSVSLLGDRALIGAINDDDLGQNSGSAYVFDFDGTNWSESAKLIANDGAEDDRFGNSVSLLGNRALIGAFYDNDNGINSGSAYVFDLNNDAWSQSAKLTPNDSIGGSRFGISVSLASDRALIGAVYDDYNGNTSGAAYVFDLHGNNWSESNKLTSHEFPGDDYFGYAVSLSSNRALIGAFRDNDNGSHSGAAYIFEFDGISWHRTSKHTAADGASGDDFGHSVSLSNDHALIGAFLDDDMSTDSGSAYVINITPQNSGSNLIAVPTLTELNLLLMTLLLILTAAFNKTLLRPS